MTYPLDALLAYSLRRATPRETVAQLIGHDGWLVPMHWALADPRRARFETLYLAEPSTVPDDELWLYTSPEALADGRAKLTHHSLGCYAGPVPGAELFEGLADTLRRIEINPGLPTDHCFFAQGRALGQIRDLARTIGLERALDQRADDLIERLIAFPGYHVLQERRVLATPQLKQPLVVFTSRDACAITARRHGLTDPATSYLPGTALFALVEHRGADGIALIGNEGAAIYELDAATCELLVRLAAKR